MNTTRGEASSALTDFLHTYIDIADAKDIEAGEAHLTGVDVRFPHATAENADDLRELLTGLWSSPVPHRHDTSNVVVREVDHHWVLDAHYVRWIFSESEAPSVVTLGTYRLKADRLLTPISLTVSRQWSKA